MRCRIPSPPARQTVAYNYHDVCRLVEPRTGRRLGWTPDCLLEMVHQLRDVDAPVEVTAEHVNPETSPPHMRLLCRLRAPWPDGYEPLGGPEYQPIAA